MHKYMQFHIRYFISFLLFTMLEVTIALYVHDRFIRPIVGDILIVVVLYSFVCSFLKHPCKYLALYIFIFATCVEVSQYFHLVTRLGLENNTFLRILLGTTFDIWDIVAYGIGCSLLFLYQISSIKRNTIIRNELS